MAQTTLMAIQLPNSWSLKGQYSHIVKGVHLIDYNILK